MSKGKSNKPVVEAVAGKQKRVQRAQDDLDQKKQKKLGESTPARKAMQAGTRVYPEVPLPDQHLEKPGLEAEMDLSPQFMAPSYKGSGKLEGMSALIGPVWTPLNPADSPPDRIKTFGKGTDISRPAQPEELSPAYVFLASPACATYITGIVLPVTGSVGA